VNAVGESDDVPSVITVFYDKLNYATADDGKVKLVGHGKKCSIAISVCTVINV